MRPEQKRERHKRKVSLSFLCRTEPNTVKIQEYCLRWSQCLRRGLRENHLFLIDLILILHWRHLVAEEAHLSLHSDLAKMFAPLGVTLSFPHSRPPLFILVTSPRSTSWKSAVRSDERWGRDHPWRVTTKALVLCCSRDQDLNQSAVQTVGLVKTCHHSCYYSNWT